MAEKRLSRRPLIQTAGLSALGTSPLKYEAIAETIPLEQGEALKESFPQNLHES